MNRLADPRFRELISASLDRLPVKLAKKLEHVNFLCGIDPTYVGLYPVGDSKDTAMCIYPAFSFDHETTIYLPDNYFKDYANELVSTVHHELGHALMKTVDFADLPDVIWSVSDYAETNYQEAFAEAFTAWMTPEWVGERARLQQHSLDTVAFFGGLAYGY